MATPSSFSSLRKWAQDVTDEGNSLGDLPMDYGTTWESEAGTMAKDVQVLERERAHPKVMCGPKAENEG